VQRSTITDEEKLIWSENLGLAAIVCIRERRTRGRESEGTWAHLKQKLRPGNTNEPFSTLNGADSRRSEPLLVWRRFPVASSVTNGILSP
jgi:hypothetical protein